MVFTAERPTVETGGREHQERRGRVCADRFPPSPARLAGVLRPRHSVGGTVSRCSPRCSELRPGRKEVLRPCAESAVDLRSELASSRTARGSALNPRWPCGGSWTIGGLCLFRPSLWVLCLSLTRLLQGVPWPSSSQGSAFPCWRPGFVPGREPKMPQATQCGQK